MEEAPRRGLIALGLGAAIGFCLWVSWKYLLDKGLPLDGGAPYLGLLFLAGASLAPVVPVDPWPGPLGLYLGQAVALVGDALLGLDAQPHLAPLRLLYLVSVSLAGVLGAYAVSAARRWIGEVVRQR
jgi:hypothetical protein